MENDAVIVKGEVVTKNMIPVCILLKEYVKWIPALFLKSKKINF